MPKKLMWNDKGLKGNGTENARIVGEDLWVDEVRNGVKIPTKAGRAKGDKGDRGDNGLDGSDGVPTDEAVANNMNVPTSQTRASTEIVVRTVTRPGERAVRSLQALQRGITA